MLNQGTVSWNTVLFGIITAKVVALFPERLIVMEALFNAWLISNFQVTFQPRYRGYIKAHCGSGERVRGK